MKIIRELFQMLKRKTFYRLLLAHLRLYLYLHLPNEREKRTNEIYNVHEKHVDLTIYTIQILFDSTKRLKHIYAA